MTFFILFLFLFSIFFTFDNKPINLLLDFIGIILSLSFYLLFINHFDLSFFSFIFIIIYGSALAILFAFILMLFNNFSFNSFMLNIPKFSFFPFKFLFNSNFFKVNLNFFIFIIALLSTHLILSYDSLFFYNSFVPSCLCKSCSFSLFIINKYYLLDSIFIINNPLILSYSFFVNNSFINYIFNSFLFNHIPLILIINILLLGLIGTVFLLI